MVRLHNSATGQIEELNPVKRGTVSMYVCGPTVYDVPHIGHGRFVLVFDILRRYLEHLGLTVVHVSNITDVDDKILARAESEGRDPSEVSEEYERIWWDTLRDLNVLRPTHTPHATAYISRMIEFTQELERIGVAYRSEDGVYFDVSAVADYGLLARQSLESLRAGARVEANPNKHSQLDFALWKSTPLDRWAWESPYGLGRPGWHTECVVMSEDLLGETFDIHGGGVDLMFPHHENERAQARALGHSFAQLWIHNGFLVVDDVKMSKSLHNYVTLPELVGSNDPRSYRLLVLQSHYRSPLEVNLGLIGDASRALVRIDAAIERYNGARNTQSVDADATVMGAFRQAMDNDLDTPSAVSLLFKTINRMNSALDRTIDGGLGLGAAIAAIVATLGLAANDDEPVIPAEVADLFKRRESARSSRDFALADALRGELEELGWIIEDGKAGGTLRRRSA